MIDWNNAPTWIVFIISALAGAACVFLGTVGSALQTWAQSKRKESIK